jgi:hypothetical protein
MTTTGPANADANGPSLHVPDYPPLPQLNSAGWVTPPPLLPPGLNDPERLARREVNHHSYHISGNQLTWYHYVLFGYYLFDRVEDFEKAWLDGQHEMHARFRIMWDCYHNNHMNKTQSSPLLTTWAHKNYAKPFLHLHEPDYLLATEILYEDCVDNDAEHLPLVQEQSWTEIGQNRRGKSNHLHSSPPSSPRPSSPTKTSDYYEPLQDNTTPDIEMAEDDKEEVQVIEPCPPVHDNQHKDNGTPTTTVTCQHPPYQLPKQSTNANLQQPFDSVILIATGTKLAILDLPNS